MIKKSILALAAIGTVAGTATRPRSRPKPAAAVTTHGERGRYYEPRRVSRAATSGAGATGRYYCKRGNGTIGLVLGAAGRRVAGRAIDTNGERATGTILGAAASALLIREVEKSLRCR